MRTSQGSKYGRRIGILGLLAVCCTGCTSWMSNGQNVEGVRLYQQAAYQGAAQRFQQAIQTDPKNPDGYYNLAATYHRQGKVQGRVGDTQQAESYYHQALDQDPNHKETYRGLAVLLVEQGRSQEAFTLLENWAARSPTSPEPKVELARLSEEFNNRDAAKANLIEALAVSPYHPRASAALGKLREESGDVNQALSNYQRSLAQNRFQPEVAARVAALQGATSTSGGVPYSTQPGTRVVTQPSATIRR